MISIQYILLSFVIGTIIGQCITYVYYLWLNKCQKKYNAQQDAAEQAAEQDAAEQAAEQAAAEQAAAEQAAAEQAAVKHTESDINTFRILLHSYANQDEFNKGDFSSITHLCSI